VAMLKNLADVDLYVRHYALSAAANFGMTDIVIVPSSASQLFADVSKFSKTVFDYFFPKSG
jgi:hypothetical protein